ncbi:MAG: hypothetical protein MI919_20575, partial [Holophagales bacterium]|nr:hypothetical protein [Holophagales bacterium]
MLRSTIPSMFHRRLLLLFAVVVVAAASLGAQLVRLTVVQGERRLADAERRLSTTQLLPTVRGTIYDRKGRPVAVDVPCSDIKVSYAVISGDWAYQQARRQAKRENRSDWPVLSFDQREALIARYRQTYDAQLDRLWDAVCTAGRIDREELEARRSAIERRVQAIRAAVWDRQSQRRALESGGPIELSDIATIQVAEETTAHTLLPAVDETVRMYFEKRVGDLPGLVVEQGKRRDYPLKRAAVRLDLASFPSPLRHDGRVTLMLDGVGDHVVGSMRRIYREDVQYIPGVRVEPRPYRTPDGSIDRGGYLPGDRRG